MTDLFVAIIKFVRVPLVAAIYICPIVGLYWYARSFNEGKKIEDTLKNIKGNETGDWSDWLMTFVYGVSFLSLFLFLSEAFEASLWFLPESWGGYDEELEKFETIQEIMGLPLATASSFIILAYMSMALQARIDQARFRDRRPR